MGGPAPGSAADVVIWDPDATRTLSAAGQHQRTDYNIFEGMQITGAPRTVLSRGRVLVQGDEWRGEQGGGRFVPRQRFARSS